MIVMAGCAALLLLAQCRHEPGALPERPQTDSLLFAASVSPGAYRYFRGTDSFYASAKPSGHTRYFRVRFNDIAWRALDAQGRLPAGNAFPEGALIVKELHGKSDGSNLKGYAVMLKKPSDPNAVQGWIWAEYTSVSAPTGILLGAQGVDCVYCHSENHRDYTRLFELF